MLPVLPRESKMENQEVAVPAVEPVKKEFKLTNGRQCILGRLDGQQAKWSELRSAYYGPERSKSKASTSFHIQLTKLMALGVVAKEGETYKLTLEGETIVSKAKEAGVDFSTAQSNAALHYVPKVVEEVATPEAAA